MLADDEASGRERFSKIPNTSDVPVCQMQTFNTALLYAMSFTIHDLAFYPWPPLN